MIDRDAMVGYTQMLLEAGRFKDYGPNGLQVEGRPAIHKLITG